MSKIRLKIDPDMITIDDLIALEEGNVKTKAARDLIAKFVVDDAGQFMSETDSRAIVGKLTLTQLVDVGKELGEQVRVLMANMVPTKTGSEL